MEHPKARIPPTRSRVQSGFGFGIIMAITALLMIYITLQSLGNLTGDPMGALCGLFVLLFPALMAALLFRATWKLHREEQLLTMYGQRVPATITHKWIKRGARGRVSFCVAYCFSARNADGETTDYHFGEYNHWAYKKYQAEDTVTVCYLPDNPGLCRMEQDGDLGER